MTSRPSGRTDPTHHGAVHPRLLQHHGDGCIDSEDHAGCSVSEKRRLREAHRHLVCSAFRQSVHDRPLAPKMIEGRGEADASFGS
jgi:hypothetical protein